MKVIAIDGPSGSGKSTISRRLAAETGLAYLDTGAMYRAVALVAVRSSIDLADADLCAKCANEVQLELTIEDPNSDLRQRVIANGQDVTFDIRSPEMSQAASKVSVHTGVREVLVRRQREWVEDHGGAVVEGRDIASVVFPDATLKVFLTADAAERAKRRQQDEHAPEFADLSHAEAHEELTKRDRRDSNREASPLVATDDAFVIDTSNHTIDQVVSEVLDAYKKHGG